jgi:hypothetical protein
MVVKGTECKRISQRNKKRFRGCPNKPCVLLQLFTDIKKNSRKNKNIKERKCMIKNKVENLFFNEKGNYQEKKQRHKKKRWVAKDAQLYCVCRGS